MTDLEGIAGTCGVVDKILVRRMLGKLVHRGPDSEGIYSDDRLALGARASKGRTREKVRAVAETDGLAIAADCYIFNGDVLKENFLEDSDEDATDADLLLSMYRAAGTSMFSYLDGAYAIAVSDHGRLVLARDRYGLKPLYISRKPAWLSFSSEMKSQLVSCEEFVPFPPGRVMVDGKRPFATRLRRIPRVRPRESDSKPSHLHDLVLASVRSCRTGPRMNVLLSGGIDSSVVAEAAAEVAGKVTTVCVGTDESEDLKMARGVANRLGTEHIEKVYGTEEMVDSLRDVIYAAESFDHPLIRSCIPNFMATHAFPDRRDVTLCGEGGDEIFAGYDYMRKIRTDAELARERRRLLRDGWITGFQRVDRMTASASLDGRMPLMSAAVIDFGLSLRRQELIGPRVQDSKLMLRKAFEHDLPKEVVWRRKQRFSDGAGSIRSLVAVADKMVSDKEFEKGRKALPRGRIRTKEELLYYRIFAELFPCDSAAIAVGITPRP